jgi:hypothetical protein
VRRARAALLLAFLLVLHGRDARSAGIPADKQALILLRVLAYDRNLAGRAGDTVRIAVLYRPGHGASERAAAELVAAAGAAERSVAGRPVRLISLPFSADTVERDLERTGASATFVCQGLEGDVARVAQATQRRAILSISSEENMVHSGLSIGVVRRGERAAILVNLVAARAEQADLSAELLRLAEVVKR